MKSKTRFAFVLLLTLVACKSPGKNEKSANYFPPEMECVGPQDPNCIGSATAGIQIPLPSMNPASRVISGQCEMIVEGEVKPRTCEELKVVLRSTRENQTRAVYFTGYGFKVKVDQLVPGEYRLEASSDKFEILNSDQAFKPNGPMKIRIRAKPRL
jgi:hypothetical protein